MTDPDMIVDHALRTGRLKLSSADAFLFNGFLIALIVMIAIFLCVFTGSGPVPDAALGVISCLVVAAAIVSIVQRRKLEFTRIETQLPREELVKGLKELAEYYDWELTASGRNILVFDAYKYIDRSFDPPMEFRVRPGERITIVFSKNGILVNSLRNLDRETRSGSPARNRENVSIIREEVGHLDKLHGWGS